VPDNVAVVTLGPRRWPLSDAQALIVGRQSTCEVRIGAAAPGPEDLGISRRAATLTYANDRLWVRNDSASQPLFIRPQIGPEHVLRWGDMISLADLRLEIVLEGRVRNYKLVVELPGAPPVDDRRRPSPGTAATNAALALSARERRLLAAICEPLLARSGARQPASYDEAAGRLGIAAHTVRNQIDDLRARLLTEGVPGMVGPQAKDSLARYAVWSGSIRMADVRALSAGPGSG